MSQFIDYHDRDLLVMDLANKLAGDLREALGHQDRASLVVPGGSTPGPIFDVLCAADIDWERVDVMLSDERWVPDTSERSNTKLLRERLLIERAAAARFVPLYLPYSEPEEGLAELRTRVSRNNAGSSEIRLYQCRTFHHKLFASRESDCSTQVIFTSANLTESHLSNQTAHNMDVYIGPVSVCTQSFLQQFWNRVEPQHVKTIVW